MLKTMFKGALSVVLVTAAATAMASKGEQWLTDMDEAKKIAAAEDKDIFMFFTGSDWCSWCIKLDDEVLSKESFLAYAKDNLVLVDLDFPNDKSGQSEETQAHHERWKDVFQPRGFPTVYLTDASAGAYAQTGYQAGGPDAYVDHLKELRSGKAEIDALTQQAYKAEGMDRARMLDEMLNKEGVLIPTRDQMIADMVTLTEGQDESLHYYYSNLKGGMDMNTDAQGVASNNQSADEKLQQLIAIFDKYSFVKEGDGLMGFLQNSMSGAFAKADKLQDGATFFAEKAADESYPVETQQAFMVHESFMFAEMGDEETAVERVQAAIDLDPETQIAESESQIYGQIRQILKRRKMRTP